MKPPEHWRREMILALVVLLTHITSAQTFTLVNEGPVVNDGGSTVSAAWGDYDNDGDLDLHTSNAGPEGNVLYENLGGGVFARVANPFIEVPHNSTVDRWADYDNDGDLDLFVAHLGGPILSFRNDNSHLVLVDLGFPYVDTRVASLIDIDNDGDLDLYATARFENNNMLFRNDGEGHYDRVTAGDAVNDGGDSTCPAWADIDNDGDQDLFVGNYSGQSDFLYRNDDGDLVRLGGSGLTEEGLNSVGCLWADPDNDGDLDLYISSTNSLFLNDGLGTFEKLVNETFTGTGNDSHGGTWADIDNDGDLDLFLAAKTGGSVNRLFVNEVDGFEEVFGGTLLFSGNFSGRAAWADYDRDGDLDVFFPNNGFNNLLLRNEGTGNHWLGIVLRGTVSNRRGIGSRVRIKTVVGGIGLWQMRDLTNTVTGTDHEEIHFGLGDAGSADSLVIRWPSGTLQVLTEVAADQLLTILEPDLTSVEQLSIVPGNNRLLRNYPNPFHSTTTIPYTLAAPAAVQLTVVDMLGRQIRVLASDGRSRGTYEVTFDATGLPSGIYFYRLQAGDYVETKRMVVVR